MVYLGGIALWFAFIFTQNWILLGAGIVLMLASSVIARRQRSRAEACELPAAHTPSLQERH